MFEGQWKVSIAVSIVPLSCKISRFGGHFDVVDGSWVMRMNGGERKVARRFMERIDLIMLLKDKGSWIRERSRWRRFAHLDSGERQLTLATQRSQ